MKNRILLRVLSVLMCVTVIVSLTLCYAAVPVAAETDSAQPAAQSIVPVISVTTENGNGCTLEKADGYVNGGITITDTDGSELSDTIEIKVRGNTTALSWVTKKSFTFKLPKKKDVLGMGKGKKWALVANAFDPTLLRNYLAFETARELGLDYTSEQRFVELWVDGSFRGSYLLFEPVQAGSDRVDIDIESNGGMNDFLVEYETTVAAVDPDDVYFTANNVRFIAKEPEEPTENQLNYLTTTLSEIISLLKTGNRALIEEKVDIRSFVKYYLYNEYYKTYDFGVTSVYFYYKDGKLYAGPAWDYDVSMGNEDPSLSTRCSEASSSQGVFANKNLLSYIAGKEWFKDLVKAEYEEHYEWFASIHTDGGILDTLRETFSDTISRNYNEAGWRVSKWWINFQRQPDKTYDGNYAFLKTWLGERHQWFEEWLEPFVREYTVGDVDGNGKINIRDATYVQIMLMGWLDNPEYELRGKGADDNLNINDVTEIQLYSLGLKTDGKVGSKATGYFRF